MATTTAQLDPETLRDLAIRLNPPQQPPSPSVAAPLQMPEPKPDLSIGAPHPQQVMAPRGTIQGDQAKRTEDITKGAGVDQIYGKITNSGFGQNHPIAGKILGGLAQGVAKLGDVGLSAVAPALAINLPGTEYHHMAELNHSNRQIGEEEKEQQSEATTQAEQGRTGLEAAQAAQIPITDQRQREQLNGQLAEHGLQLGEDGKVGPVSMENLSPEIAAKLQGQWKPVAGAQGPKGEPLEYNETTGQYRSAPGVEGAQAGRETKTIQREVNGKPHTILLDAQGNDLRDLGETGEKPPTVNVNAGEASLDRLAGRLAKPYDTANTQAQGKFDRIQQTLHSIDAGYVGQGLGIPELLTALVSGQGTGVRITQAELNAITANRGIQGNAESWFNSLAGKGKLTDTDKSQIKTVLADAQARLLIKQTIVNDALDKINGANSREEVSAADREARSRIMQVEQHGFYIGQEIPGKGHVIGFKDGKVQVDDGR